MTDLKMTNTIDHMQDHHLAPIISYTGNKLRYMDEIINNIPSGISDVHDLFGGSSVVSTNLLAAGVCNVCHYNEIDPNIFLLVFHATTSDNFIFHVERINEAYEDTEEGYYRLRSDYNKQYYASPVIRYAHLFVLHCRSFNNQLRFNKLGEFNLPYGKRNNVKQRLDAVRASRQLLRTKLMSWSNQTYKRAYNTVCKAGKFNSRLLFVDPPYRNSVATYNESGSWSLNDDIELLKTLEDATEKGIRWIMTNTTWNRGKPNDLLIEWLNTNNFDVSELNCRHGNSSYYKSDKKTIEVLIKNY